MWIENRLRGLFASFGRHLVLNAYLRWSCLIVPVLLTIFLASSMRRLLHERSEAEPIRNMTPMNAEAWYEQDVIEEHWPLKQDEFTAGTTKWLQYLFVSIVSRPRCIDQGVNNDCNLLQPQYMDAITQLEATIANISIIASDNSTYSYDNRDNQTQSLCMSFWGKCVRLGGGSDRALEILANITFYESERSLRVEYPIMHVREGKDVYLRMFLYGVEKHDNGTIAFVSLIRLVYALKGDLPEQSERADRWARTASNWLENDFPNTEQAKLLNIAYKTADSVPSAMRATTAALRPKFIITFVVLVIFCILNMFDLKIIRIGGFPVPMVDWNGYKKWWLALAGIGTAILGIAGAIGVDDMFIMVAAWNSVSQVVTDTSEIMAQTMSDAVMAITITSLTSAISFAVGAITQIPAVRIFGCYAAVCITMNYIFQVIFFGACLAFHSIHSESKRTEKPAVKNIETAQIGSMNGWSANQIVKEGMSVITKPDAESSIHQMQSTTHHTDTTIKQEQRLSDRFFSEYYGPVLLGDWCREIVTCLYLMLIAGAIYGCIQKKQGLEMVRLMFPDDPAAIYHRRSDLYSQDVTSRVDIVFNSPGALSSSRNRKGVESVVKAYENSRYTMVNSTEFWMKAYTEYVTKQTAAPVDNTIKTWVTDVRQWMSSYTYYEQWSKDLRFTLAESDDVHSDFCDDFSCLTAFRFRISVKEDFTLAELPDMTVAYREIAKHYSQPPYNYNITISHFTGPIADQMLIVEPNTLQNIGIALICMLIVSILFMPDIVGTICIVIAMISIDTCVAGYLFLWDCNLDQITMVNLIMSIGLSIDFSAHIIFGYVNADELSNPTERVIRAMQQLAWPVFQGGTSTLIGVSVLMSVQSYMILTFFKTVFLVIVFGVAHALIFLPVLLATVMPFMNLVIDRCKHYSKSSSSSTASTSAS